MPIDIAHPFARSICVGDAPYFARQTARACDVSNSIQMDDRSVATSPLVISPQSITPVMVPSETSTFLACKSPCSQRDSVASGAVNACSQICSKSEVTLWLRLRKRSRRFSKLGVRWRSGVPRTLLLGAVGGAGWCKASKNSAKTGAWFASGGSMSAVSPGIHGTMLHDHG